jgi:hypothetical protein
MATIIWISAGGAGQDGSFNTAANWSTGVVPGTATSDTVVFDGTGTTDLTTGLDQHAPAHAFVAFVVYQANTCNIGTISGSTRTYLQHNAPSVTIGQRQGSGFPTGSTLLMFDSAANACTYTIFDSANQSAILTNLPPIQLKGTALTIDSSGGNFGVCCGAAETSTVASCTTSLNASGNLTTSPANVFFGAGTTLTVLSMNAGTCLDQRTHTGSTITISSGATYTYQGTGATTTLTINNGGYVYYSGTGTITTLNETGRFDRSQDGGSVTITNWNIYFGASINLANGVSGSTIRTNSPSLLGCAMQDITIQTNTGELF